MVVYQSILVRLATGHPSAPHTAPSPLVSSVSIIGLLESNLFHFPLLINPAVGIDIDGSSYQSFQPRSAVNPRGTRAHFNFQGSDRVAQPPRMAVSDGCGEVVYISLSGSRAGSKILEWPVKPISPISSVELKVECDLLAH